MTKRWWPWFKDLRRSGKVSVMGAAASLVGLLCLPLALRNDPKPTQEQVKVGGAAAGIQIKVDGNENRTKVNQAGRDQYIYEYKNNVAKPKLVQKVFLKADKDGSAPVVKTKSPGENISNLPKSGDVDGALKWLFEDVLANALSCVPGTEVEILEAGKSVGDSPLGRAVNKIHSKIKILSDPYKNTEGWVLSELLEYKLVPVQDAVKR